jgi:hypothetical protein
VDDPARVRVLERLAQGRPDADDVAVRQRPVALEVGQRAAADELGREVERLVVVARVVQRDDPRVAEPGGGQRLALGPRRAPAVDRDPLQRDRPVEALVVREPDRPEAARAEAALDAVAPQDERALGPGGAEDRPGRCRRMSGWLPTVLVSPSLRGLRAATENLQMTEPPC